MKERFYKMRKERVIINQVEFTVKHISSDDLYKMAQHVIRNSKSLDDCYKKPSVIKESIYREWKAWSMDVKNLYTFDVDTYNTNVFTLSGVLEYSFGMVEVIHITPTKHILYTA